MKRLILTALGAIAMAGILISTPASAWDYKDYPGVFCQPYYGSQAGDFTTGYRSIKNNTSQSRWVSCPIINDNGNRYGAVEVSHRSPYGNTVATTCYAINMNRAGNYHSFGIDSNVSSGASRTLLINSKVRSDTHYQTVWCLLPPNTELNWYGVSSYFIT